MPKHYRFFALLVVLAPLTLWAQSATAPLPRRAFLGIAMAAPQPGEKGVKIDRVVPKSTAEGAGLQPGDVLVKIGDTEPTTGAEVIATLKNYRPGQKVQFTVNRNGKSVNLEGALKTFPTLQFADINVEYSTIVTNGARQRTIVTSSKRASGRHPAILFIQGVGCYSLDAPNDTANAHTQLLNYLTRQGFVTLRVDKPGQGESEGTPCGELDFNGEAAVYRQALRALRSRPDVDSNNVFIIGHSMGGVFGPLVAQDVPVKGIVTFGTLAVNFMEYFTNSRRVIAEAREMKPAEADAYVREQVACFYDHVLHDAPLPSSGGAGGGPSACKELIEGFSFRSKAFYRQLEALNVPGLWDRYRGHALAMRGEADYVSTRSEHELIADIVNRNYPGHGTFMAQPATDHGMHQAASMQAALAQDVGPFNPAVAQAIGQWMRSKLNAPMGGATNGTGAVDAIDEILRMDGVENAYPRVSADGREIVFQSNRAGKWQLFRMNLDGTNQRALTDGKSNDNFVDWSRDGSQIAFVSDRDGNEEIYVMRADGSAPRRLTRDTARDIHPYFSPDSRKILFNSTRHTEGRNFEIYEMNVDGSGLRRLTDTPDEETCARYSPDMQSIVYLRGDIELGNDEVFLMRPDGTGVRNLTNTPRAAEGWPTWSADGTRIVYASTEGAGTFRLFEIAPDGTGKRRLTDAQRPRYDARPATAPGLAGVVFNRQEGKTIGIYYLRS